MKYELHYSELTKRVYIVAENVKQDVTDDYEFIVKRREKKNALMICPCCGSNRTYQTDAIHCNSCAMTTEM